MTHDELPDEDWMPQPPPDNVLDLNDDDVRLEVLANLIDNPAYYE